MDSEIKVAFEVGGDGVMLCGLAQGFKIQKRKHERALGSRPAGLATKSCGRAPSSPIKVSHPEHANLTTILVTADAGCGKCVYVSADVATPVLTLEV